MHINFKALIGKIVVLDMVNGKELTARLEKLEGEVLTIKKPIMFVPIPNPNNPNHTNVAPFPYGSPMYDTQPTITINTNHVITVFEPSQQQKDSYIKHTSNIVAANINDLNKLPDIDFSKFKL